MAVKLAGPLKKFAEEDVRTIYAGLSRLDSAMARSPVLKELHFDVKNRLTGAINSGRKLPLQPEKEMLEKHLANLTTSHTRILSQFMESRSLRGRK